MTSQQRDTKMLQRAKSWAKVVKRDVVAVYFASRDPRTPTVVRVLAIAVAAYALSPIDLIPDFIPNVGYLDELIIVPLDLILFIRMLPAETLIVARLRASEVIARPRSYAAATVIVVVWLAAVTAFALWWFGRQ